MFVYFEKTKRMETKVQILAFDPNGDQGSVFPRWERWLRAVELYFTGKNVTAPKQKKALLLHFGGFELQDVFYAIPGADTVAAEEDAYDKTRTALNDYFKPKTNKTYERHIFRGLAQRDEETMNQFVTRLRQQAKNCEFVSIDEEIKDQIVEKCRSVKVKKRILEQGDMTLNQVIEMAQAHEATTVQLKTMEVETVSKISGKKGRSQGVENMVKGGGKLCYRCGYTAHFQADLKCPAKNKKCTKCDKVGHFAKMCRSKKG